MSNAFTHSDAISFARKAALDCVLPAIGVSLHHKECGFQANEQLGFAAFAIYTALNYLPDVECKVGYAQMVEYMGQAIELVHTRNRDKKVMYLTNTPEEMVDIAVSMRWVSNDEDQLSLTSKWVHLTQTSHALLPLSERITDETRRVPFIKGNKVPASKLFKEAAQFLSDTSYHVESRMGQAVYGVIESWKRSNMTNINAKLYPRLDAEMYVHKGSELVMNEEELFSEQSGDARGRLYHEACFGPNPQSGDMARAYYSHNVENWVDKGSDAYDIFITELRDVAGSDEWMSPAYLAFAGNKPDEAIEKILQREIDGKSIPSKPLTYVRMAYDWLQFETTGKCDSRLGYGEDAKCSGTQILAILAGSHELVEATGFRTTAGTSDDPYMLCLKNIKKLLKVNPLGAKVDESILTRNFAKRPYMSVQYGGGKAALLTNKDFISALDSTGLGTQDMAAFVELTLNAVKITLGERINKLIEALQLAVSNKLMDTSKAYLSYTHIDNLKVVKPCFEKDIIICDAFSIRVGADTLVNFGNVKEKTPWTTQAREPSAEEFVRTFVVHFVQGIDALIARTVAKKAKQAGLRGYTSIHDCFRVCLADAPKLHNVIAEAYKEIFIDNNPLTHLAKQLGGI